MATIEMQTAKKHSSAKKVHKKNTRVDLTPMVDLGFLLITFFVFTTTMAKPRVMNIVQPPITDIITPVCESCALTVILTKNDGILYYEGLPANKHPFKSCNFSAAGIRALLTQKKAAVEKARGSANDMVLIVKPADESCYRNFVDILDEVAITGVKHYFIDEVNEADKKLLAENNY